MKIAVFSARKWRGIIFALCLSMWGMRPVAAQNVRLYVDDSGGNDIAVVDLATRKKIDDIVVGERPHGLAVQADGRRLFTTIESNNTLRIIDTATDKILATVPLTGRPNQCAVTPDGKYVVIPIRDGNSADIVDVGRRKVVKVLPIKMPHNAVDAGSNRYVFVSSMGSNEVDEIDLRQMSYAAQIPVGGVPRPYVVSRDGHTMYVALSYLHGFAIVNVPQRKVIKKFEMPAQHRRPEERAYEPSNTLTHGLALSPDGRELWVTSLLDNCLYIYDVKAGKITGSVPVGDGPNWVAFSPDGKYVVVSNSGSDDVSIIDVQSRREVARVKTGRIPKRVVIAEVQ
ncbi:MAG TPA: beta-propeller fold lactonase family protein [Terriglobales bacterium]|nr:beta-propeller fold lactonase family protein [Terriglobales bacterium]